MARDRMLVGRLRYVRGVGLCPIIYSCLECRSGLTFLHGSFGHARTRFRVSGRYDHIPADERLWLPPSHGGYRPWPETTSSESDYTGLPWCLAVTSKARYQATIDLHDKQIDQSSQPRSAFIYSSSHAKLSPCRSDCDKSIMLAPVRRVVHPKTQVDAVIQSMRVKYISQSRRTQVQTWQERQCINSTSRTGVSDFGVARTLDCSAVRSGIRL